MAFNDGVKVGPIAYIGLVSVLGMVVLVLLLQVLYYHQRNALEEADLAAEGPPQELAELTSQQQLALTQRGYVDRQRGIVAIGAERAKELVVTELADGEAPSEVVGPKRPVAPAAKASAEAETAEAEPAKAAKEPAKTDEGKPAAETAGADTKAEASDPSEAKEEPKNDDPS